MWKGVISFCRDHILVTVCTTLVTSGLAGYSLGWSLYEARVNRVEELKIESVKNLEKERENMLVLVQSFTSGLINGDKLDAQKRDEIAASLSRQYSGYNAYTRNLSPQDTIAVKALQTSLNDFRKSLLAVKKTEDLDPVYLDMNNMFKAFKTVDAIVDKTIKTDQAVSS